MNKDKKMISNAAVTAVICALYIVLTLVFAPISFGSVQFRIAELLMILCFYRKNYCVALSLGCLLSNLLFSPMGWPDVVFGTLATVLSALFMYLSKNIIISAIFPCVFNGMIVGAELYFVLELPFALSALSVFAGEAVVMAVGVAVFELLEKNKTVSTLLKLRKS